MSEQLGKKLAKAWQRRYQQSVTIENIRALSAGASATSYALELRSAESVIKAVLQLNTGDAQFGVALNKLQQALVQDTAHHAGIETPVVLLTVGDADGLAEGFVSSFVDGETLGSRIVADARFEAAREQLGQQCAQTLASIHGLDIHAFPQLQLRDAATQLEELTQIHKSFAEPLPSFAAAAAWMRQHLPQCQQPCLVHGDFRLGNLLVNSDGLAGVLDWELAHLGDPMEDIAWLCLRSWRFGQDAKPVGGFALRQEFYSAYEHASGRKIDHQAVRFWEVLGAYKWGVICQWFAHRRLNGELTQLEPALIGRRVSEAEIQMLELLGARLPNTIPTSDQQAVELSSTEHFGNRPYRHELFELLQDWLQQLSQGLQPSRYELRLATHALTILNREAELGSAAASFERNRLQTLLAQSSGTLEQLSQTLCQQLNDGAMSWDFPELLDQLMANVHARLAIDNPNFIKA